MTPPATQHSGEKNSRCSSIEVFEDLLEKTPLSSSPEKHVALCFDEMKVQEDLIWGKHTKELIGFVHLGDKTLIMQPL